MKTFSERFTWLVNSVLRPWLERVRGKRRKPGVNAVATLLKESQTNICNWMNGMEPRDTQGQTGLARIAEMLAAVYPGDEAARVATWLFTGEGGAPGEPSPRPAEAADKPPAVVQADAAPQVAEPYFLVLHGPDGTTRRLPPGSFSLYLRAGGSLWINGNALAPTG